MTDDRDRGVRSYLWSRDSRRILYSQDQGGDENHHLMAVEVDGGRTRDLTPFTGVRAGLIAAPRATPGHVLVSMNLRDRSVFDAYRLTLATGQLRLVARNPGNIIGWLADREGLLRAARAQTPAGDYELLVRDREDGEFRVVAEFANEDGGHAFAFTPDGARLWVGSARGSDLERLVELDPADGSERELDRDEEADLSGPVISDLTGELLGAVYLRDRTVMHPFDERFGRDWEAVRALHPGDPHITGQDADETAWIVAFDDDRDPGATYLFDRATGAAELLYRSRPWLDPATLAPMRPGHDHIARRAGAPLATSRCRSTPSRAACRRCWWCTAGPWARDAWGYDPQAQFLANRGYAVLQVNYRGSTGFGKSVHPRGRARVRRADARRPDRRRRVAGGRGHRRPRPRRHLRRVLRRLRGAGRARRSRPTCSPRRQRRRAVEPGDAGALVPAVLAPVPGEHVVPLRRRPRRPGAGRRPRGALAAEPASNASGAAAGDPGRQRPARDEGRVRPDRRGPARAAASRWSTW